MWDCGSNSHNQIIYCTLTFSNLLFPSIKALGNSMNRGSNKSLARLASGKPYSLDEPLWPSEQEAGALRGFLPASLGEGNSYICSSVMPSWPTAFPTSTTLKNGDDLLGWTNMPFLEWPHAFARACPGVLMNACVGDIPAAYKVMMWPGSSWATGDAPCSDTQEGNTCWGCTH